MTARAVFSEARPLTPDEIAHRWGCSGETVRSPPPGHPYTMADYVCGLFRDEFDWSSLDREYLERIGAMKNGSLRPKPRRLPSVPLHAAGADCLRRDGVVENEE